MFKLIGRQLKVTLNIRAIFSARDATALQQSPSLPSLGWQLFTTSETGETFSILKTLFKTLRQSPPAWLWTVCSLQLRVLSKLGELDNSHALHID